MPLTITLLEPKTVDPTVPNGLAVAIGFCWNDPSTVAADILEPNMAVAAGDDAMLAVGCGGIVGVAVPNMEVPIAASEFMLAPSPWSMSVRSGTARSL